jgi:poly-gamma-glutamate synthesis protein (capsule biosynthesis protein)
VKKLILILVLLLSACLPSIEGAPQFLIQPLPSTPEASMGNGVPILWINPLVPDALRQIALKWSLWVSLDSAYSNLRLDIDDNEPLLGENRETNWIYALVTPFPTVIDGVTSKELMDGWHGSSTTPFSGRPFLMDAATLAVFSAVWGPPAPGIIQTAPSDQLLDIAWRDRPSWAIVPFENLDPRWKVLTVDSQSPIDKNFVSSQTLSGTTIKYPLMISFRLSCIDPCPVSPLPALPPSNRDPSKMTVVVMTGTTSLVRGTAYMMNIKGITYPGRDIQAWLAQADITHISNETSFYDLCPPPVMDLIGLKFCSDPSYIALLNYVGADVVELTGNHLIDYGPQPFLDTLALYRQNNILYYGGGENLSDARQPLLIENHGNKIAFIGCNSVNIGQYPTAASDRPGAAPCDYNYVTQQIAQLRSQGYLVIMTFQYYETLDSQPFAAQVRDFRLMAQAGADIVQGSQAHFPQSMEFYQGGFIHYGLGNLFFDQMGDDPKMPGIRREFIDRHVFYDGRYISTELLTAMLEDYSRPRPMTADERAAFLTEYFSLSGW